MCSRSHIIYAGGLARRLFPICPPCFKLHVDRNELCSPHLSISTYCLPFKRRTWCVCDACSLPEPASLQKQTENLRRRQRTRISWSRCASAAANQLLWLCPTWLLGLVGMRHPLTRKAAQTWKRSHNLPRSWPLAACGPLLATARVVITGQGQRLNFFS